MATIKTRYNCSNWLRKQRNRVDPIKSAGCWTKKQPAKVPSKANHKPSQHLQQQPKLRVGAKKMKKQQRNEKENGFFLASRWWSWESSRPCPTLTSSWSISLDFLHVQHGPRPRRHPHPFWLRPDRTTRFFWKNRLTTPRWVATHH